MSLTATLLAKARPRLRELTLRLEDEEMLLLDNWSGMFDWLGVF
jgi:hypothetical protein